jgi:glycosyltransferase involved in cell wall biosynthesis
MQPGSLRIAFATPQYVTEERFDGGIAQYLHRVAKALAAMGHDIHIVTLSKIDETEFEHEGVTVHRVMASKAWPHINRLTRYRLTTTTYQLDLSVRVYRKLKQLNAKPFDLMQVPNASYCGLVSTFLLRVPHVLRASSYRPTHNDFAGIARKLDARMVEFLERLQFSLSRHIFAPSQSLRQMLAEEAGLERARVIRTPMYVETRDWDRSIHDQFLKNKKYLLFFGRFELRKGFHVLAQALPRFLAQYPDAQVVLVGRDTESALAPSMAEYARSFCRDAAERLTIIDQLPHRQLYPIIAEAHLIVLPSVVDNLPNACLEAMALGKAVIGTTGASFDEMISDEETGFLVSRNSVDELAEKIIHAWTHPKLKEIGEEAQRKMQSEFSSDTAVAKLLAFYYEVLGRH